MRILIYSHDSYGLGHLRRCMTLAQALSDRIPGAAILIVTGSPCATHFALPPGVEVVKLPSVTKDEDGRCVSRSLALGLPAVMRLRRSLLEESLRAFEPDVLVVDHRVVGLGGELTEVLAEARRRGVATVLGLRDVIDAPAAVAREWADPITRRALSESYDRICIYGWPTLFDHRSEYPLPRAVLDRVEFTGLVVRPPPRQRIRPLPASRQSVLVTVGGGQDGGESLMAYLESLALAPFDWDTRLLCGPLLDVGSARELRRQARLLGRISVHEFKADVPRLLSECDAVVAMAGYNTTAEILQSGTPAVLLPRSFPRREQLIRAERLARLGLVECIPVPTPETLRSAVERALVPRRGPRAAVPLDGAERFADVVLELTGASAAPQRQEAVRA